MDLVIDEDLTNPDDVCQYLNNKLYTDPEFFGDFGPENIGQINLEDGTPVYSHDHGYYQWMKFKLNYIRQMIILL